MTEPVVVSEDLKRKAADIERLLETEYGRPPRRERRPPLDQLILTVLSQHTSDANSDRAFDRLKARFQTWEDVRGADPEEIADAIRPGGLAAIKAPRIKDLLERISEERGRPTLDFLKGMGLEDARKYLLGLNGVGPKTAAVVLLFSLGLPAFPVDTHVHRVTRRLGLIGPNVTAEDAHRLMDAMVPPEDAYPFHINLITHGRRVCKAPRPLCEICVLAEKCDYYQAVVRGERRESRL